MLQDHTGARTPVAYAGSLGGATGWVERVGSRGALAFLSHPPAVLTRMDIDDQLHQLAAHQHGLITVAQTRELGVSRDAWRHRLRQGRWQRLSPSVARLCGAPTTPGSQALAAVLEAAGPSALFGASALAWWDLAGFRLLPVTVIRRTGKARSLAPHGQLLTCRTFTEAHWAIVDGVPCSTPTRAIFDLARAGTHPGKVERAIDTAWARSLVSGRSLHAMLDELGARGRPGITVMRELLESRPVSYRPPESGLERRFQQIIADDGQLPFRRQIETGGMEWLGRMDFVDDLPFIVLIDSDRYHGSLLDQAADQAQTLALEQAGYVVLRITQYDVWYRGREVADHVRAERNALRFGTKPPPAWAPQRGQLGPQLQPT